MDGRADRSVVEGVGAAAERDAAARTVDLGARAEIDCPCAATITVAVEHHVERVGGENVRGAAAEDHRVVGAQVEGFAGDAIAGEGVADSQVGAAADGRKRDVAIRGKRGAHRDVAGVVDADRASAGLVDRAECEGGRGVVEADRAAGGVGGRKTTNHVGLRQVDPVGGRRAECPGGSYQRSAAEVDVAANQRDIASGRRAANSTAGSRSQSGIPPMPVSAIAAAPVDSTVPPE